MFIKKRFWHFGYLIFIILLHWSLETCGMQLRKKIYRILRNKYIITLIVFFLWILFFDQNNLVNRFSEVRRIRQLEADKDYFKDRIKTDSTRLNELKTDSDNLEKFAREQYLMKRENEEIFIIEFDD